MRGGIELREEARFFSLLEPSPASSANAELLCLLQRCLLMDLLMGCHYSEAFPLALLAPLREPKSVIPALTTTIHPYNS